MNGEPAGGTEYRDTIELLKRARGGNVEAEEQLIRDNMALVHSVAKRFRDRGADYEDLFQIGCVGFVKAIKNFDLSYNVCFSESLARFVYADPHQRLRSA